MATPRPPDEVLRRVLKTSRSNGWSVAIFAVLSFLISIFTGGALGLGMGVLVIVGGVMEILGNRRLRRRDPDGMKLLVNSQLVVLVAIWAWAVPSLFSFDTGYLRDQVIPNAREMFSASGLNLDALLEQAGFSASQIVPLVHLFFVVLYGSIMLATLLYQGGMVFYYRHRIDAVTAALRAPPAIPPAMAAVAVPVAPTLAAVEQRFFDAVAEEMAQKNLKPGLWARALAEVGANDARAEALYIRLRVAQLRQEESARQP